MKRKRSKANHEQMTLFPFLAVLVCTLGVLIILLVIVTKMADDQAAGARRAAAEKTESELDRIQLDLETEKIRVEAIRDLRPGLQKKLTQAQALRSHVEDEMQVLKEEISEAQAKLVAFENKGPTVPVVATAMFEEKIRKLDEQIQAAKDKKESLRKKASQAQAYSIVPNDGEGGIRRRPIYVECTASGLVLQPHGIVLKSDDFQRPVMPGNPFDSALLAVREYWTQLGLVDSNTLPYPLLVVRPHGAEAYGLARQAMRNWDDQFGYELIDQEKKLAFGKKDPVLTARLQKVVDDAKRFQERIAARSQKAGGIGGKRMPAGGLRASPTGGFVAADGNGMATGVRSSSRGQNDSNALNPLRRQTGKSNSAKQARNQTPDNPSSKSNSMARSDSKTASKSNQNGPESKSAGAGSIQPISKRRGKNWALPTRTAGATAYKRPIRIICSEKEILIRPAASHQLLKIPFDQNPTRTVDQLVNQVWKIIDSWDIAGAGGYWKPELIVEVTGQGQKNFSAIQRLLDGSGLAITRAAK